MGKNMKIENLRIKLIEDILLIFPKLINK